MQKMNILFYNIFLWLYKVGAQLISPWNHKAKLWLAGRKNIFAKIRSEFSAGNNEVVWMHAASLGEFEQGTPVLEKIRLLYPHSKIVVSFFSPSGYEIIKNYAGADYITYLPADSKANANKFIELINPKLVLWIKYEYWYYYLEALKKKQIPLLLISAVFYPDYIFLKWYGSLHKKMMHNFTHLFLQTEESKKLIAEICITENVTVSSDTRFDRVTEIAENVGSFPVIEKFCGKNIPVIVAGSTWEEDEEELDHYANAHAEIKFIIAPHEINEERLKEVESLFRRSIRYSELEKYMTDGRGPMTDLVSSNSQRSATNVLIIDNIGMLSRLYKYATITYVGGGFGDDGIHNVLEAAVYGKPVLYGPVIEKYVEAIELADCGGGIVVDSALEVESVLDRLLTNPEEYYHACEASKNYVYARRGATEKIIQFIQANRLLTTS
jgi:3-deoxy-D-manno-octulosonic-acid transferase